MLFLLYINDISNTVNHCNIRLFADDTCLFIEVDSSKDNDNCREEAANFIDNDLKEIQTWADKWLITFSPPKTKSLIISNKPDYHLNPRIHLNGFEIEEVKHHTYLGLKFSSNLKWSEHINTISTKARKRLNLMIPLKFKLDRKSLETMYMSFVLPITEYCNVVWGGTYETDLQKLEKIHIDAMRIVTGATAKCSLNKLYLETKWSSLSQRHHKSVALMMFKIKNNLSPEYLTYLLPPDNAERTTYNLRNRDDIYLPTFRLESYRRSFIPYATRVWNDLPLELRNLNNLKDFRTKLYCDKPEPSILYYYGQRWPAIHHARMRIGCSKLQYDLNFKDIRS